MKLSKLLLMMICTMSLIVLTGCSLIEPAEAPEQPTYIPAGCVAEVATLTTIECWITNAATGKREKRILEAQPGYWLGRPRVVPMGQDAAPASKGVYRRVTRVGPNEFDMPVADMPQAPECKPGYACPITRKN